MNIGWREYGRLPTSDVRLPETKTQSILGLRFQVPKRYSRLLYGFVAISGLIFFFNAGLLHRHNNPHPYPQVLLTPSNNRDLPPLFEAYTEYEDHLPQQLDESKERKYIFMANHAYGCGWGNVLQDMIYSSLVASESGRG